MVLEEVLHGLSRFLALFLVKQAEVRLAVVEYLLNRLLWVSSNLFIELDLSHDILGAGIGGHPGVVLRHVINQYLPLFQLNITLRPYQKLLNSTIGYCFLLQKCGGGCLTALILPFQKFRIDKLHEFLPVALAESIHGFISTVSLNLLEMLLEFFGEFENSVDLVRLLDILFALVQKQVALWGHEHLTDVSHD